MRVIHYMAKRRLNQVDGIGIGLMWALVSHRFFWSAAICFLVTAAVSGLTEAVSQASPKSAEGG